MPTDEVAATLDPICLDTLTAETRRELERRAQYHAHILRLYGGTPLSFMHGQRDGRYVHIRPIDDIMTAGIAIWLAGKCRKADGRALDILAWEYADGLDAPALITAIQERYGVTVSLHVIPREVMEHGAKPADVHFYSLPTLRVETGVDARTVTVTLCGYDVPADDRPPALRGLLGSDLLDAWAVDWDWQGDALTVGWSAQRERSKRGQASSPLARSATHEYAAPGRYRVLVQACDLLGMQTRAVMSVEVSA